MTNEQNVGSPVKEDDDPFDIWMTMGVLIGGRTRHLELLLTQIKNNPDLKIVFTKTSVGKLTIKEVDADEYYKNRTEKK